MTDFKQLLTAFERYAYGQSLHTAFVDMLDWMLLPFKLHNDSASQRTALKAYQEHPKIQKLAELIKMIGDLSEGFSDPLGELFMQAISNGHNGQYFTPEPICDMMSAITIGTLEDSQTVYDPACGSGRVLLSAAKLNRNARFYGADLDITCCKMALLNMLLNSLTGEIAHMNTLSNEFYVGYKVNTTLVAGYHQPYYMEFSKPENSYIWLKPLKAKEAFEKPFVPVKSKGAINGLQGSLF